MKIKNLLLGVALMAGMSLTSCSGGDDPTPTFVDFVTLDSFSPSGATMTFREKGDSPLITLTTTQALPADKFKAGTRIVISYASDNNLQYVSGPIMLYQAANTEGEGKPALIETAEANDNWATESISMRSLNRSGEYLDFVFIGTTSQNGKTLKLVLDAATANSEMPEYHLIYKSDTSGTVNNYVYYCSYSIADSWLSPTAKGVRVYFKDTVGGDKYVDLLK
jgi:lipoprotein